MLASSRSARLSLIEIPLSMRTLGVVAAFTATGAIAGSLMAALQPKEFAYEALLQTGEILSARSSRVLGTGIERNTEELSGSKVASIEEVKAYLNFALASEQSVPDDTPKARLRAVTRVRDTQLLRIMTRGTDLDVANAEMEVILTRLKAKFDPDFQASRKMIGARVRINEERTKQSKSTLNQIDQELQSRSIPAATLLLLRLQRQGIASDLDFLARERLFLDALDTPEKNFSFRYLDRKPVSMRPVYPNAAAWALVSAFAGFLLSLLVLVVMRHTWNPNRI